MKVIGLEVKISASGRRCEAKIVPFELVLPEALAHFYGPIVYLEVTAHTSLGDVTASVPLPKDHPGDPLTLSQAIVEEALAELGRRVEALT